MGKTSAAESPKKGQKRYSYPVLTPAKLAAVKRGDFDFLFPFQKNLLRSDEIAVILGRSTAFVRELGRNGKLETQVDCAWGERESYRYTRRSFILYCAEKANYDPSFLVIRIEALMKGLNAAALNRLMKTAQTLLHRIS